MHAAVEIEKRVVSDVEGKLPGGPPFVILEKKCVACISSSRNGAMEG